MENAHDGDPFDEDDNDPNNNRANGNMNHNNNDNQNILMDDDDDDNEHNHDALADINDNAAADVAAAKFHVYPDGSIDGGVAHAAVGAAAVAGDDANEGNASPPELANQCDLMLHLECTESIFVNVTSNHQHPILRPGVTVAVGLDKTTKLIAVFSRYVEFCNANAPKSANSAVGGMDATAAEFKIELSDLEFVHCQLLKSDDTVEASALMKNDRIRVRRSRDDERAYEAEQYRLQRESDREYFKRLRLALLHDSPGNNSSSSTPCNWCSDLVLDCRGKLVDEHGRSQEVLRSTVRAHSVILAKRCKWLADHIQVAREEQARRSIVTIPEQGDDDANMQLLLSSSSTHTATSMQRWNSSSAAAAANGNIHQRNVTISSIGSDGINNDNKIAADGPQSSSMMVMAMKSRSDDASFEDDDIVLHFPMDRNPQPMLLGRVGAAAGGECAAEIENDEEDDEDHDNFGLPPFDLTTPHNLHQSGAIQDFEDGCPVESPILSTTATGFGHELWVTIPKHSPLAVKLLLEYCYTNRVVALGRDAFAEASRPSKADASSSTNRHNHHHNINKGPVPPFTSAGARRWPNNGLPQISFGVAMAGIALAEEASMPRFSLMCEVAASQLISTVHHAVEALCFCTTVAHQRSGANPFPRLRQAAMEFVFRGGSKGVIDLARSSSFRRALEDKSKLLVPSLLSGTMEAITTYLGKRKRDANNNNNNNVVNGIAPTANSTTETTSALNAMSTTTTTYFQRMDRDDARHRDMERRKRRRVRWDDDSDHSCHSPSREVGLAGDYYDDDFGDKDHDGTGELMYRPPMDWALAEATLRSMNRMTRSRSSGAAATDSLGASLSRYVNNAGGNRKGNAFDRLASSSRRTGS